jgi:hypothetical protein
MKRALWLSVTLAVVGVIGWLIFRQSQRPAHSLPPKPRTVDDVMAVLSPMLEPLWKKRFARAELSYPPAALTLVALKKEQLLEIYATDSQNKTRLVHRYPILAASGEAGPKYREGDRQVPEGFYRISLLNPNSSYHLSLRVNYPSNEDVAQAREDQRDISNLGGDIMIHGSFFSTGCLAMGDPAAEEIFFLAARTGLDPISVLIAPWDLVKSDSVPPNQPDWMQERYQRLRTAIGEIRQKTKS